MLKIDILTIFPKMFAGPFSESIVKRAQEKKAVSIEIHDLRRWTKDKHQTVDDRPFGGGVGMVMMCEPIFAAIEELQSKNADAYVIYLTPKGKPFTQKAARSLSTQNHLIVICGHYEEIDQRVKDALVDEEISIGDYVLTGGELPAMVLTDAVVRLLPGVVEGEGATEDDSFSGAEGLLEYPHYTRPAEFRKMKVPDILLSGNHAEITKWRKNQALALTKKRRPDLIKKR